MSRKLRGGQANGSIPARKYSPLVEIAYLTDVMESIQQIETPRRIGDGPPFFRSEQAKLELNIIVFTQLIRFFYSKYVSNNRDFEFLKNVHQKEKALGMCYLMKTINDNINDLLKQYRDAYRKRLANNVVTWARNAVGRETNRAGDGITYLQKTAEDEVELLIKNFKHYMTLQDKAGSDEGKSGDVDAPQDTTEFMITE